MFSSSLPVVFALLACSAGSAQAQSGISGRVVDVTGAVVPGVAVVLRRENGQVAGDTVTDAAGGFTFPVLDADRYVITAALEGFSLARVELSVTRFPATLELVLRPGAFAEDLTVIGSRLAGSEEMLRRLPGSFHLLTRDTQPALGLRMTSCHREVWVKTLPSKDCLKPACGPGMC